MMKAAAITGANGFIGRWLVKELLESGIDVYAVIRKGRYQNITEYESRINLVECELKDYLNLKNILPKGKIDTFYHLAWEGVGGTGRADYEKQLLNEKYACDAAILAQEIGCRRFICTGTVTEKLIQSGQEHITDNMIYGICKVSTKQLLRVICQRLGMQFVWAQLSNIYGPYNNTGNLIDYLLKELEGNKEPAFSKGEEFYDFMYVGDTVRALRLLGNAERPDKEYFIGSGAPMLLKEYLRKIASILDKESQIKLGMREDDGLHYEKDWFDIAKLVRDTGYHTSYSLETGIKETMAWIRKKGGNEDV